MANYTASFGADKYTFGSKQAGIKTFIYTFMLSNVSCTTLYIFINGFFAQELKSKLGFLTYQ